MPPLLHAKDLPHRLAPVARLLVALLLATSVPGAQEAPGVPTTFEGASCLACGDGIEGTGRELQHRGRTVRLHEGACADHWNEDSAAVFAQLQPKAALWDEPNDPPPALGKGWLYFGYYVLSSLLVAALCAYLAIGRRLPARRWFFTGLVFNVGGLLALLTRGEGDERAIEGIPRGLGKVATTHSPARCESCGTSLHPSATRCSACGTERTASATSEVELIGGGAQ